MTSLINNKNFALVADIAAAVILTAYVYAMLRYMDNLLATQIATYQPIRSYGLGGLVFFIAVTVISIIARKLDWRNLTNYFIAALGIFFPLVVLASIFRIVIGLPEETMLAYTREYCEIETINDLCGPAFAHIAFSMTIRALPIVVTVPLLYRLLSVGFTKLLRLYSVSKAR